MYKHFIKRLKEKYKDNILLYMDTDSLITLITCKNIYADINDDIEFYDTSTLIKTLINQLNPECIKNYLDY